MLPEKAKQYRCCKTTVGSIRNRTLSIKTKVQLLYDIKPRMLLY